MTTTTTDPAQLDQTLAAAEAAAPRTAAASPVERAARLRAAADGLDAAIDDLVPLAIGESHLPERRLRGEVARTSGQLRMFAAALETGSVVEPVIDTADPEAVPVPRPDLRRMLLPVGPVLVFAAGNFPFAFSVGGGDTASALAAGCPVVVKAHPGHPATSRRTHEVLARALEEAGAPGGVLGIVHGTDAGVDALRDRRVKAAGFTGSVTGGVALHEIAATRPEPIPFYGELGSINPVFVTEAAVRARGAAIAEGFVASYTLGVGQFCTKPGLLFLPSGHGLEEALTAAEQVAAAPMLHPGIRDGFASGLERMTKVDGVETLVGGRAAAGGEDAAVPATLLRTTVGTLVDQAETLLEECFGPVSLVVEYDDPAQLDEVVRHLGGSLTSTVHAEEDEHERVRDLHALLTARAGRVVWNGWPTGVAVAWAMHHGGPFPSTVGSLHTSVGVTAVRRFQRPVCYQDTPESLLPVELRDANELALERRVDGVVTRDGLGSRR
jgi:NADP-dependent aldehyde dehydrogenase